MLHALDGELLLEAEEVLGTEEEAPPGPSPPRETELTGQPPLRLERGV